MQECEKHDQVMIRIFNEINENKLLLTEINTKVSIFKDFNEKMHIILFGNGKEGLVSKLNRIGAQILLQWGLIVVLLGWIFWLGKK